MSTRTNRMSVVADDYLELVRRFPLRPIGDERELDEATEIAARLAARGEGNLTSGQADYLDALSDFIWLYEQKHHPVE